MAQPAMAQIKKRLTNSSVMWGRQKNLLVLTAQSVLRVWENMQAITVYLLVISQRWNMAKVHVMILTIVMKSQAKPQFAILTTIARVTKNSYKKKLLSLAQLQLSLQSSKVSSLQLFFRYLLPLLNLDTVFLELCSLSHYLWYYSLSINCLQCIRQWEAVVSLNLERNQLENVANTWQTSYCFAHSWASVLAMYIS